MFVESNPNEKELLVNPIIILLKVYYFECDIFPAYSYIIVTKYKLGSTDEDVV